MRRHLSLFVTVGLLMLSAWLAFSVFHGYQEEARTRRTGRTARSWPATSSTPATAPDVALKMEPMGDEK
jgi:hypothetical protein